MGTHLARLLFFGRCMVLTVCVFPYVLFYLFYCGTVPWQKKKKNELSQEGFLSAMVLHYSHCRGVSYAYLFVFRSIATLVQFITSCLGNGATHCGPVLFHIS